MFSGKQIENRAASQLKEDKSMKLITLLLCLICFAPFSVEAARYKHKTEAQIAALTPAQRVDEWVDEWVHHRNDVLDPQNNLLRRYEVIDGLKAVPRLIEIIDEYDPTRFPKDRGRKSERYEACSIMLNYLDSSAVRLRSAEIGKKGIDAFERSIERMRAAGYGKEDQHEWNEQHSLFEVATIQLDRLKGINDSDKDIVETFRFIYKISLSNAEIVEFSSYLIAHYPEYPSWSAREFTKDPSQLTDRGTPVQITTLIKPERYYESYLEFKKTELQ